MNELHDNDLHNVEQLSPSNLVNRHPSVVNISQAEMAEDTTPFPSVRTPFGNGRDTQPGTQQGAAAGEPAQLNPLFPQDELQSFRSHWSDVQTSFVDEPRKAVELADDLVANVIKRVAEQFASEREELEKQWDRGAQVDTEDLRQAFKRYRAFFDRLLAF
jgi:hypothetical protein